MAVELRIFQISSDNLVMENQTELIQLMKEQMKEDQKTIDHIQKQNIKLQQKVHDLKEKIKIKRTTFDQNMTYFDNMTQEPPISPNKLAFINGMIFDILFFRITVIVTIF